MKKFPESIMDAFFLKRQIPIVGRIDWESQDIILPLIFAHNAVSTELPVTLLIHSTGGEVEPGLHIADTIEQSTCPVHAIVTGMAHSAAFVMLQACAIRKAYPHATLMYHAPKTNGLRCDQEERAAKTMAENKILHSEQIKKLVRRSGQPEEKWFEWAKAEREFTATEALELRIIDEIIRKPEREP